MKLQLAGMTTTPSERSADSDTASAIAIYWQEQYRNEPYYDPGFTFMDYLPAFQLGSENYSSETTFENSEDQLFRQWSQAKGKSRLKWSQARDAVRAGWYHIKRAKKAYGPIWVRH